MYTRRRRITPFDGTNGGSLVSRCHLISSTSISCCYEPLFEHYLRGDDHLYTRSKRANMDRLRVGVALYNVGRHLAAHEPLEELWLEAPAGDRDDYLKGLIQACAAVYKSRTGNEAGAAGLAESAVGYVDAVGDPGTATHGRVDAGALVEWLGRLAADPDLGTRESPPEVRLDGEAVGVYDLAPAGVVAAAEAVAETGDDDLLRAAVGYAESDLDAGDESSPFVTLTLDYVRDPAPIVRQRLREHVGRRRSRAADVEGLFE